MPCADAFRRTTYNHNRYSLKKISTQLCLLSREKRNRFVTSFFVPEIKHNNMGHPVYSAFYVASIFHLSYSHVPYRDEYVIKFKLIFVNAVKRLSI